MAGPGGVDLAMSGGSGGTGGGIDWGLGDAIGAFCGCLETTGGSLANTSRNIARKSSKLDFYVRR